MPTPTYSTVISQINTFIVANGNNEITANILNPILKLLIDFSESSIGNLATLTTDESDNIVNAINSLKANINGISNSGIKLFTGNDTPINTPPLNFDYGDFYMELSFIGNNPVQLWQWNGFNWINSSDIQTATSEAAGVVFTNSNSLTPVVYLKEEVDTFINAIQFPDEVLKYGIVTLSGLDISILANSFQWKINQVDHLITPSFSATLTPATATFVKYVILVGKADGTYAIKNGVEGAVTAAIPTAEANTVVLAVINVVGASIATVVPAVVGFVKESEGQTARLNLTGAVDFVTLSAYAANITFLSGTSISGFNIPSPFLRSGKDYYIRNYTGANFTLKNALGTGNVKFFLKDGDLIMPNNTVAHFKYSQDGYDVSIGVLILVGVQTIATVTGLQTTLDLKANIASPTFTGTVTAPTFVGALTGVASGNLTGSGTTNQIAKFTASGAVGNTVMSENNSGKINIGGTSFSEILNIQNTSNINALVDFKNTTGNFSVGVLTGGNFSIRESFVAERFSIYKTSGFIGINQPNPTERLDVVGNGKFSGYMLSGQFTTATRPVYVKGAEFFDTTLNKKVVGGATDWEVQLSEILTSANGSKYRITVDNSGALITTLI